MCQEDEWTCVVLPGIGFGWVKNNQIIRTEHEAIDSEHRNDVSVEWELVMSQWGQSASVRPEAIDSVLEHIGAFVTTISFSGNSGLDGDDEADDIDTLLTVILKRCENLKHLRLSTQLSDADMDPLISALNGDLGSCLLSLDLDGNLPSSSQVLSESQYCSTSE